MMFIKRGFFTTIFVGSPEPDYPSIKKGSLSRTTTIHPTLNAVGTLKHKGQDNVVINVKSIPEIDLNRRWFLVHAQTKKS